MNNLEYLKLKKILLKHYRNTRVLTELRGIVNTRNFIEDTRVTLNRNKLIISNENQDFTVEFMYMKKIKLNEYEHLELIYQDFTVILEL